jgi:mannose-6-phosphate isomerase-like protein (cupin superfamily)
MASSPKGRSPIVAFAGIDPADACHGEIPLFTAPLVPYIECKLAPSQERSSSVNPIRRIVTGHDPDGKAIVVEDGPLHKVVSIEKIPGTVFHEIWSTEGAPAIVDNSPDPTLGRLTLPPPRHGTRIRVVDIPPDTEEFLEHGGARMQDAFAQIGDASASTVRADSPHPLMHRTESIDYGIVLEGEMTLVLDDSEVALHPGDVVVQRGTNHAWANRSGRICRMLFVLVDGQYDAGLATALEAH